MNTIWPHSFACDDEMYDLDITLGFNLELWVSLSIICWTCFPGTTFLLDIARYNNFVLGKWCNLHVTLEITSQQGDKISFLWAEREHKCKGDKGEKESEFTNIEELVITDDGSGWCKCEDILVNGISPGPCLISTVCLDRFLRLKKEQHKSEFSSLRDVRSVSVFTS